jgi:phosphoglycolate phosphatase-like HAD superfamily hydrolase
MSLDIPRIRALCFDMDGTLSDTDDYYAARFSARLRGVPFIPDPERFARRLVMWMESPANALLGLADTIGLDDEMIATINWMSRHRRTQSRPLPPVPGVPALLASIQGRYPVAVVSSRDENSTMAFLEHENLLQHFGIVVTALTAKRTKPYPDPIQFAAQKFGVAPESCLMIGDTTVDIRAGKSAGTQTVGVLCGFGEEAELRRQGADLILRTTADLGSVLLGEGR